MLSHRTGPTGTWHLTAQGVRDLVIDRLVAGVYPLGSQLPTSRQLAEEIGAHRNTVAKAYQLLAQIGLVTVRQGRGTFVVAELSDGNAHSLADQIEKSIADQIVKARRIGIPETDLRSMLEQQVTAAYQHVPRGLFVECNWEDMDAAITEIESTTGLRLAPLLIDQLKLNPAKEIAGYSLVVTILSHIKEVTSYVEDSGVPVEVIGVYTQPDEDVLHEIAQIEPGSRVGIVVDYPQGVWRFANRINSVTTVETKALVSPTDDELRGLSRQVDVFVCNRFRSGQIERLNLGVPIIEMRFHLSRQSIGRVSDALLGPSEVTEVLAAGASPS